MMARIDFTLVVLAGMFATQANAQEKITVPPVSETIVGRVKPNRLSEFKISLDGMSVAYRVGSGRFGTVPDSDDPQWQYQTLIVNGRPEGPDNPWYENTDWGVYSPDHRQKASLVKSYVAAGPSYVVLNDKVFKSFGQVRAPQFSPDSKHFAYFASTLQPYGDMVVIDGIEGKKYQSITKDGNLKFSPDSQHTAYIASVGGLDDRQVFVVVDGNEGKRYSGINIGPVFSPDSSHVAYAARITGNKLTIVIDGSEGRAFDAKNIDGLVFSPDSKQLAYSVKMDFNDGAYVVVGDAAGPQFKSVWPGKVQFSADSKHFAYAANDGEKWHLVIDHQDAGSFEFVSDLTYSPVDLHLAYVVVGGRRSYVVRDGVAGPKYDSVTNLLYSPDGKILAYAAYLKKQRKWKVVVDGRESPPYDFVLAENAYEEKTAHSVKGSSLRFESADTLKYLAIRKNDIVLGRVSK